MILGFIEQEKEVREVTAKQQIEEKEIAAKKRIESQEILKKDMTELFDAKVIIFIGYLHSNTYVL